MDAKTLLERLFPGGCDVAFDGIYFSGTGHCAGTDVAVIGTVDNTPIGIELAFRMAGEVLEVVRHHPGRPILLLVDTQGQRLSHRDELLGINGYMAHLAWRISPSASTLPGAADTASWGSCTPTR